MGMNKVEMADVSRDDTNVGRTKREKVWRKR